MTTSNEIAVALRSSRTRTTVPSRISRTIGSAASERAFQLCQSACTLRHTRLTTSLPTAPSNNAPKRAAHPPRIGAGKVGAGNQRVGKARVRR